MENLQVPNNNAKVKAIPQIRLHVGVDQRIVFAFPGMGKTPICRKRAGCFDMDFGAYRTALDVEKKDESALYASFAKYILTVQEWSGAYIFTNEPGLLKFLPPSKCVMFLPASRRTASYCADKMGVDVDTVWEWIQGWKDTALKEGIPLCLTDVRIDKLLLLEEHQRVTADKQLNQVKWIRS